MFSPGEKRGKREKEGVLFQGHEEFSESTRVRCPHRDRTGKYAVSTSDNVNGWKVRIGKWSVESRRGGGG